MIAARTSLLIAGTLAWTMSGCAVNGEPGPSDDGPQAPQPGAQDSLVETGPRLLVSDTEGPFSGLERDEATPLREMSAADADISKGVRDVKSGNCTGSVGSSGFCGPGCPCASGEGDCDNDAECQSGLTCMRDTGAIYGFDADVDVCLEACSGVGLGTPDFCAPGCPCQAGQGDCDDNNDCAAGTTCVQNIGAQFGFAANIDVCVDSCDASFVGNWDFCTEECGACSLGQGDCDSDSQCGPGLQCADNVGAQFGFRADVDVCVMACDPLLNGTFNYCSPGCLCSNGEGDCDSDADCAPGHRCVEDIGANYGFSSDVDICLSSQVLFAGQVLDDLGRAVANATIDINNQSVLTGSDGRFEITVGGSARYVINIRKANYVAPTRIHSGAGMNDLVFILEQAQAFAIDPTSVTPVEDPKGTRLVVPANALVDENGHAPTGPVNVQLRTYNPVVESMPGDYGAIDVSGTPVMLESLGAVNVDFVGAGGKRYQLGPGQQAQLSIAIPPELSYPGSEIAMWQFDEATGQWMEDGLATVSNGYAYFLADHFSSWNFDVKRTDPACVRLEAPAELVPEDGSLRARVVATGTGFTRTRYPDLTTGFNVFYNLPPNAVVDVYIPPSASTPLVTVDAGAPWGGTAGFPEYPYSACNGQATLPVVVLPSRLTGYALMQDRVTRNAGGVTVRVYASGTSTIVAETTTDSRGRFLFDIPSGDYDIEFLHAGHLPVRFDAQTVLPGKVKFLECVELLGGDLIKDDVIDALDLLDLTDNFDPTCSSLGSKHDLNGDGCIDNADRDILSGNLGRTGPTVPPGALCRSGTGQLTTTFNDNNGQDGNMFNITALSAVTIIGFDGNLDRGNHSFEIWYRAGGHNGQEGNPSAWTLAGTVSVTSPGNGLPTAIPLPLSIPIPAGSRYGFYLRSNQGVSYTNGTNVGRVYAADANIQIHEGYGVAGRFGRLFSPRIWNGTVYYEF